MRDNIEFTDMPDNIEFTDRYKALGIPYPDPESMCLGECEGTGFVPIRENDVPDDYAQDFIDAERESPSDDGWHFLRCHDCAGTGKRIDAQSARGD